MRLNGLEAFALPLPSAVQAHEIWKSPEGAGFARVYLRASGVPMSVGGVSEFEKLKSPRKPASQNAVLGRSLGFFEVNVSAGDVCAWEDPVFMPLGQDRETKGVV